MLDGACDVPYLVLVLCASFPAYTLYMLCAACPFPYLLPSPLQLLEQQDSVAALLHDAEEAKENVSSGRTELRKARERPSVMRDFTVAFSAAMACALLFLHYYSA